MEKTDHAIEWAVLPDIGTIAVTICQRIVNFLEQAALIEENQI